MSFGVSNDRGFLALMVIGKVRNGQLRRAATLASGLPVQTRRRSTNHTKISNHMRRTMIPKTSSCQPPIAQLSFLRRDKMEKRPGELEICLCRPSLDERTWRTNELIVFLTCGISA